MDDFLVQYAVLDGRQVAEGAGQCDGEVMLAVRTALPRYVAERVRKKTKY